MKKKPRGKIRVAIIMGSESDMPVMKEAAEALDLLGVSNETSILSAHRTPVETTHFAVNARKKGIQVIIAGAGGAAHLAGFVAAHTELPVIGVPVPTGHLQGQDALLSIVQMPRGIPVATVAIGNAYNAGILAGQILAAGGKSSDQALLNRVKKYKQDLRKKVLAKGVNKK